MSETNPKYECPYCKDPVLVSRYYNHQKRLHLTEFWTETNLKLVLSALVQAKRGKVDIIQVADVKGHKDAYWLNPFNETLYKSETKATQSLNRMKTADKTPELLVEWINTLLDKLKYTPPPADAPVPISDNETVKKAFQTLFNINDGQIQEINRYERLISKLRDRLVEYGIENDMFDTIKDEEDIEAEREARDNFEPDELLPSDLIKRLSIAAPHIPFTRKAAFAPKVDTPPEPPAPIPPPAEKTPDIIIVKKEEPAPVEPSPVVEPSIPPLEPQAPSKPKASSVIKASVLNAPIPEPIPTQPQFKVLSDTKIRIMKKTVSLRQPGLN